MKTKYYFFAALATVMLASCADDQFVGDNSPTTGNETEGSIQFALNAQNATRAGEFVGATAAAKLGGMFVVEGTKGDEQSDSPSKDVVFDNYLVGYTANTAGTTESNTHNWEYVGLEAGITDRMSSDTWTALHTAGDKIAATQSIKYWDYTQDQYDFIAWSTGTCEAIPVPTPAAEPASGKIQVSRIATGSDLSTSGFTMTASSADDLLQCYYTDITTVLKADYNKPVTLTFKNMAAKVRVALYETVPGYSVKEVKFYPAEANDPAAPDDLGTATGLSETATLFTTGTDVLPQSGKVKVYYPHIGTTHRKNPPTTPSTKDYNKASVEVDPGTTTATKQEFGALTDQYREETGNEPDGKYLGITLPAATFAGDAKKDYYTAVIPNTNGMPLTLRVDYTLVATDGSDEEIKVYGAKAVVPATYTVWQPNYAYTYIFKISDNTNGWTSQTSTDPAGLFPITFDAMVASFTDANAEQTTVTTVATPSITTYQQGHTKANNEYSKAQTAGVSPDVKDLYVQVMKTDGSASPLYSDLNGEKKSLLFAITKGESDYVASEAEVMDALQNRTNLYSDASPVGRNGITLTNNTNIKNDVTKILNGVDDQPITVTQYTTAEINIDQLTEGTYAYVYSTKVPTKDEKVYHVAAATAENFTHYYPVTLGASETVKETGSKATGGMVYFIPNKNAKNEVESYTFKQTKVNDDVTGLVEKSVPTAKATAGTYSASTFYFDVYNQNDGEYAVKVIKVTD
jgi:hypothetical protein